MSEVPGPKIDVADGDHRRTERGSETPLGYERTYAERLAENVGLAYAANAVTDSPQIFTRKKARHCRRPTRFLRVLGTD